MIKNYLKTAWRNLARNRTATLINLFGLSVSLVAFLFIALWVQNELSFDSFHKDAKDIYLLETGPANDAVALTAYPAARSVAKTSGAMFVTEMIGWRGTINANGLLVEEKTAAMVDSNWFNVFSYAILRGDVRAFNSNPYSVILTQSKAKQLFGASDPVGQVVKLDTTLFKVQAVVKDNPVNSSLQFDMLIPMDIRIARRPGTLTDWGNLSFRSFVKVRPGTNISSFEQAASLLTQRDSKGRCSVSTQPISELHFDTTSIDPIFRRGSHAAVWVFSILGILLLVTASINYINLTIAKANVRTKEISVRKIMGGSRTQLFCQFLTESLLLCVLAMSISLVIILVTLPAFDRFVETPFQLSLFSPILWRVLPATLLFTTVLNGLFPALTMSVFKPMDFLQGHSILKFRNILVRKGLVVFQFVVGAVFIIGTVVIFLQMRLAQTSSVQYNRSQVLSFQVPYKVLNKMNYSADSVDLLTQTFRNELLRNSSVEQVALASNSMEEMGNSSGVSNYYTPGMDTGSKARVYHMSADPEVQGMFSLPMKEGRWFKDRQADRKNYVLNETAVKAFGLREPVVGRLFARYKGDTGIVIGVIKDYNFNSLYSKIDAVVIACNENDDLHARFFVRTTAGHIPQTIDAVAAVWHQLIHDAPFEYQFMDEAFDNLYKNDLKLARLVLIFSCVSLLISTLGLFGLAVFVAEQRKKEIGIRKVLGATVSQIAAILSKDFVTLVLIAVVIASPIAYWVMNRWLQNFAYRVTIQWWIFPSAGLLILLVALSIVSRQTIRAATANPVKSLRAQ